VAKENFSSGDGAGTDRVLVADGNPIEDSHARDYSDE
jgi:hypothetical protein